MKNNDLLNLYKKLKNKHGQPQGLWHWWCKRPKIMAEREQVIIGAILTQNTNWKNVELCFQQLKKMKCCSLRSIYKLGQQDITRLAELIRSSGFYNSKAKYLFKIAEFFIENGGINKIKNQNFKTTRKQLLELIGVGPETADSILLYALDKPAFVVDEYTRRFVKKNKLAKNLNYDYLQKYFESRLPGNYKLYQNFHALIVIEEQYRKKQSANMRNTKN